MGMPVRIVVIAESDADRRHICALVDRKIRDHAPDWWDERQIEHEREWCGLEPGTLFTPWAQLKRFKARAGALRSSGFIGFDGRTGERRYDYPATRIALMVCHLAEPRPDAVVLVRDMDKDPKSRRASICAAEAEFCSLRVVLALPEAKREAWVLNGFVPRDEGEQARYREVSEDFSFDLVMRAEELHAEKHGTKRDAKRVLRALMPPEREEACWMETPWAVLRANGEGSGQAEFLAAVKDRLVPLFADQRA